MAREVSAKKAKCPICNAKISAEDANAHYEHEKAILNEMTPVEWKRKRGAAVAAKIKLQTADKVNKVLAKIAKNRKSRRKSKTSSEESATEFVQCCICNENIFGDSLVVNAHIDACLSRQEARAAAISDEEAETYTWAGQTRTRATTLLNAPFESFGYSSSSNKEAFDDANDLDIDGDLEQQFGRAQYDESSLEKFKQPRQQEEEESEAFKAQKQLLTPISKMDALVDRIRELQEEQVKAPRCLICLELYSTPLVSINCWHVYCEGCWLQSLNNRKLCPQCNLITTPGDLRRIFL